MTTPPPPSGWSSPDGREPVAEPDRPGPQAAAPQFTAPPGWGGPSEFQAPPGWGPQPGAGWGAPRPPEVKPGVIPLRPLGLGELLDGAVALIRRYPRPALGFSAAVALVSTVLNLVLTLTAFQPLLNLDETTIESGDLDGLQGALGGAALGGLSAGVVSALATLVLTGIMTAIAGRAVLGQPVTFREAWAQVRPALPRLIGVALLTALLVYGSVIAVLLLAGVLVVVLGTSLLFLAVPLVLGAIALAVYLYGRLSLAPAAALLENAGVRQSLRRSGVLVRRSWWRVFGILVLTLIIGGVVGQIAQAPFLVFGALPTGLSSLTDPSGSSVLILVLSAIGGGFAQTIVAPFSGGVRALLYIDRRMRAEGLDVALTAAAQDAGTLPSSPAG